MKMGQRIRLIAPKGWNRYFALFGAVCVNSGQFLYALSDRKNSQTFMAFLERVVSTFSGQTIWLILDNVKYHRSEVVVEWLMQHPQVHLVWLPRYDPQNNPVERVWNWLKSQVAAHRAYDDLQPLKQACENELQGLTPQSILQLTSLAA